MFAGGILQPGEVIEIMVVQLVVEGLKSPFQFGKVQDASRLGIDGAGYVNPDAVGMAVESPAFVPLRKVWQHMGGLKRDVFIDFHA